METKPSTETICTNCGGKYGLHNNMNQRCPKNINSPNDHTEYRDTVFLEGQGKEVTAMTAMVEFLKKELDGTIMPMKKLLLDGCIAKATELLAKERDQIEKAWSNGYLETSRTETHETYFTNTY